MPVVKWIQEDQRVKSGANKTKPMSSWKNWKQAKTGRDNEIAIVRRALAEIKLCLDHATPNNTTDLYLSNSKKHKAMFDKGILRLKTHVVDYIDDTTSTRLFVAYENITAMASSPTTNQDDLNFGSTRKSMNTIIIHNPFTVSYTVGGQAKSLSDWGRYITVLHELTHSLLRTKDVWIKNTVYGVAPADPNNAVSTDDECKDLAKVPSSNALNVKYAPHISWYNAENWARAIGSCHPTRAADAMYV